MKNPIEQLLERGMLKAAMKILNGKICYNRDLIKGLKQRIEELEKKSK